MERDEEEMKRKWEEEVRRTPGGRECEGKQGGGK